MFPNMSSLRKKGPGRKNSTRYTTKPSASRPEFEMLSPSGKSNGFIIQITEGRTSESKEIQIDTAMHDTTQTEPRRKPQPPPLAIPPKAHIIQEHRPVTPPSSSPKEPCYTPPADIPLPRSSAPTPALVESGKAQSPTSETPIMRSMFPRYDPSRPLDRQSYYPHLESVPGLASAMAVAGSSNTHRNSNNPYRQQMAIKSLENVRTTLDSDQPRNTMAKDLLLRSLEVSEQPTVFSKPEELDEIWNVSNGQAASEEATDTYSLELSW